MLFQCYFPLDSLSLTAHAVLLLCSARRQRHVCHVHSSPALLTCSFDQAKHWLPWWLCALGIQLQCRRHGRHGFTPWMEKIPWRRTWQSAPAFLPGKPHRQRNLAGYSPLNTRYMLRYNWQKLIKPSLVPGIIKNRTDWLVIIKVTKQHKIGKNTECKIKLPRGPMVSQSVIHQEQAMNTDLAGNVSFMRIQKCWIKNF